MRIETEWKICGAPGRLALLLICALFTAGGAYAQSGGPSGNAGSCTVTQLRFRFATSNDDLRGGHDNLNIAVYFSDGAYQLAPNVNKSQNWPNNSVNMVEIALNYPVAPNQIRAFRLVHITDGGFNIGNMPELATLAAPIAIAEAFKSPDNWNMADVEIAALGNGVGSRIATHGYHRFTGSDPVLTILAQVPANICGSGGPAGNSGGGDGSLNTAVNPGGSGLHSVMGANGGSNYGALTNNDVVKMAKSGVPESTIVASIRSNPAQFETAPDDLIKLRQQGISENILREMQNRNADPNNNPKAKLSANDNGRSADDLNPQPYPPKSIANNPQGTLLPAGSQQTMLGAQVNSPSSTSNKSALIPAVQRPMITDGTTQGSITGSGKTAITDGTVPGAVRQANTPTIGVRQTMSAQGNVGSSAIQQRTNNTVAPRLTASSGNLAGAPKPIAIRENPNLYVSQACAADPSFRVLSISGTPDNKTLTVGTQYTVVGCSFGNPPTVKPIRSPNSVSQNRTAAVTPSKPMDYAVAVYATPFKTAWFVYAEISSWSDNAIVITFPASAAVDPHGSVAGMDMPAQLWVTRGDGQTEIYGQAGELYFKPTN